MYKYLTNYFPDNYNPDNYWPGYDAVAPVTAGGSGMHRRYWDDRELQRQREDEELILLMAAWLA